MKKMLSILMIVKNEEKKLERCLKSLEHIRKNIDSELIITDTGSTDKTIEIARKYTDKILHFEWCDDFAAARNVGLEIADGEWCIYIDADEVFEDSRAIVDFFNTGEYREYNSARIKMYHYTLGIGKENIRVSTKEKMFKKNKDTRFTGKIHEFVNLMPPTKILGAKLFHDGYVFETAEEKLKKSKRNLVPILEMHKENPKDLRVVIQMLQEYQFVEDFKGLYEEGKRNIKESMDQGALPAWGTINVLTIVGALGLNHMDEALSLAQSYFKVMSKVEYEDMYTMDINYFGGKILLEKKEWEKSIEYINNYLRLYEELEQGKERTVDIVGLGHLVYEKRFYIDGVQMIVRGLMELGRYEEAMLQITTAKELLEDICKDILIQQIGTEIIIKKHGIWKECELKTTVAIKEFLEGYLVNEEKREKQDKINNLLDIYFEIIRKISNELYSEALVSSPVTNITPVEVKTEKEFVGLKGEKNFHQKAIAILRENQA